MTGVALRGAVVAVVPLLAMLGCFEPKLEGFHCGEQDECPSGLECDPFFRICVSSVEPCGDGPCPELVGVFPTEPLRDLDVLFVIDNTSTMADEQASLVDNFHRFISALQVNGGELPNLHVGVISPDMGAGPFNISNCSGDGDEGALHSAPMGACTPPTGAFISDVSDGAGGRITNYTGTLAETFECIGRLGINGCGYEQPLESMRRALNGSNPTNSGFLRPDAFLGVILLTDEDDCSTSDTNMFDTSQNTISDPLGPLSSYRCFEFGVICEPDVPRSAGPRENCRVREDSNFMFGVAEYASFLRDLKDDPFKVAFAGIFGAPTPVSVVLNVDGHPRLEPSCESAFGGADPGVRLHEFAGLLGVRHLYEAICSGDLWNSLVHAARLLTTGMGDGAWCLAGDIDQDKATAEVEHACRVSYVELQAGELTGEVYIPECSSSSPGPGEEPCWSLSESVDCDHTESGQALTLHENTTPAAATHVQALCLVQP